jgi:hypothetical protein
MERVRMEWRSGEDGVKMEGSEGGGGWSEEGYCPREEIYGFFLAH